MVVAEQQCEGKKESGMTKDCMKKDNGKGKQTGQECQLGKATGTVQDRVGWRVRIEALGAF